MELRLDLGGILNISQIAISLFHAFKEPYANAFAIGNISGFQFKHFANLAWCENSRSVNFHLAETEQRSFVNRDNRPGAIFGLLLLRLTQTSLKVTLGMHESRDTI